MAAYLDTSFLVPLFFHETASAAVLVRARSESELWISHWTLAEFSSAVAFKLRTGQTATFIIFQTPEEGIGFPMSLKGFGEGYDKLP